ncbi:MAG: META domain-containing protein [Coriobacteriia bacterium]|nr:META domain-containing protein [Actinomycetota bacterium]MDZ4167800.1 META domain-containing protein [Coriobacteriia bacterium]
MRTAALSALIAVGLGLLVAAGCTAIGSAGDLENAEWSLVASSVSSSNLGAAGITARFADGLVGGTGGVNSYGAEYELGRSGAIETGDVTSTLIAAVDEEANAAEAAYFALLREVAAYRVDGTILTLSDAGGNELLVFERAE